MFRKKENEFYISNGVVYMDISTKKFPNTICLLDENDLHLVLGGGKWYASSCSGLRPYVHRSRRGDKMHRVIMNPPHGMMIDHINGDELDNRRENLRICTAKENCMNSGLSVRNKSGVRGVYRHSQIPKWVAQAKAAGKTYHLGCFDTVEEAAEALKDFRIEVGYHPNHGSKRG